MCTHKWRGSSTRQPCMRDADWLSRNARFSARTTISPRSKPSPAVAPQFDYVHSNHRPGSLYSCSHELIKQLLTLYNRAVETQTTILVAAALLLLGHQGDATGWLIDGKFTVDLHGKFEI